MASCLFGLQVGTISPRLTCWEPGEEQQPGCRWLRAHDSPSLTSFQLSDSGALRLSSSAAAPGIPRLSPHWAPRSERARPGRRAGTGLMPPAALPEAPPPAPAPPFPAPPPVREVTAATFPTCHRPYRPYCRLPGISPQGSTVSCRFGLWRMLPFFSRSSREILPLGIFSPSLCRIM